MLGPFAGPDLCPIMKDFELSRSRLRNGRNFLPVYLAPRVNINPSRKSQLETRYMIGSRTVTGE